MVFGLPPVAHGRDGVFAGLQAVPVVSAAEGDGVNTVLGFTGTRRGMTDAQSREVDQLTRFAFSELHHGDCVGADLDMHVIARANRLRVVIHPPLDQRLRAGLKGDVVCPPKDYLARNRDIVAESDALLATPAESSEHWKGGTWYTVHHAQEQGKPVIIVWPDGSVKASSIAILRRSALSDFERELVHWSTGAEWM